MMAVKITNFQFLLGNGTLSVLGAIESQTGVVIGAPVCVVAENGHTLGCFVEVRESGLIVALQLGQMLTKFRIHHQRHHDHSAVLTVVPE